MSLVALMHGALHPAGGRTVEAVLDRVRQRLPGVPVRPAYVGHGRPSLADVLLEVPAAAIVVPLLLTGGLPDMTHVVTGPLGPDRLLAEVVQQRLREAGARPGQPVVLAGAGSADATIAGDTARAAGLLGDLWGGPVAAAHLTGRGPRMSEIAAGFRALGLASPAVAPYLVASGHHYRKALEDARSLGLATVAEPLGDHPLVAETLARRYRAAAAHRFALSLR